MSAVRVVIVDDEPLALERLKGLVAAIPAATVVGTANGCRTGIEAIARYRPDLALLDIKMRDGTAFELLSSLPAGTAPMIAFATAYMRYACQAFEVNALDYVLKPVDPERLQLLVEKAARHRDLLTAEKRTRELERIVEQLREADVDEGHGYETELWVRRKGTEHVRVPVSAIDWIGALDDYVSIHAGDLEHLLRASLDSMQELLDPSLFVRIHRSSIVRRDRIAKVAATLTGSRVAVLTDGTRLAIGRTHATRLGWNSSPESRSRP